MKVFEVRLAFPEGEELHHLLSLLASGYGASNVTFGHGEHQNGIPHGTVLIERTKK